MDSADALARVRVTNSLAQRRLPLLLVAAAVLLLGWLVAPNPVPLYDGIGTPDEPYRYVVPPAGYRSTPPASEARTEIRIDGGRSCCELEARSAEQGPQVAVYVPRGGLAASGGGDISVLAEPVAAPAEPAPVAKGKFEGNVYRVSARGPAGPATLTPEGARATLQLRALNGNSPGPDVWYRVDPTAPWRQLPTGKVGFDVFETQFAGAGDYVLVRGAGGGGGSTLTVLLGILAIPAILVVALLVLRLRRGPLPDEDDEPAAGDEAAEDDEPARPGPAADGPEPPQPSGR